MRTPKDFSHLDLAGRNFIQAKMFGADLSGTNLWNVKRSEGWKLVGDE